MRGERIFAGLSVLFGVFFAVLGCLPAFGGPYVVQDDARQHIFWMEQLNDPALFPRDLIAEYFRSVAPAGFVLFYRAAAALGASPLEVAKVVPVLLSAVCALFTHYLALRLFDAPLAAFLASFVVVSNLWLLDALANATPRAFGYPLFLAFSYYLVKRSIAGTAVSALLLGLFYPGLAILSGALLASTLIGPRDRRTWAIFVLGALAVAAVVLPYGLARSRFGPILDEATARAMPELAPGGRSEFFAADPFAFYFCGERSGLVPLEWCWAGRLSGSRVLSSVLAAVFAGVLAWPLVALRRGQNALAYFPRVIAASLAAFVLAHAFLFRLHLPSRYAQPSLRIAFGLAFGALVARGLHRIFARSRTAGWVAGAALAAAISVTPFAEQRVAWHGWVKGEHPALYAFLAAQPKDIVVASLEEEAGNLPVFARRSVLVSGEHAIPYHLGYYGELRRRAEALAAAEAARDPAELAAIIDRYMIDYWLIGQAALAAAPGSVLSARAAACRVFQDGELWLLDAPCLIRSSSQRRSSRFGPDARDRRTRRSRTSLPGTRANDRSCSRRYTRCG